MSLYEAGSVTFAFSLSPLSSASKVGGIVAKHLKIEKSGGVKEANMRRSMQALFFFLFLLIAHQAFADAIYRYDGLSFTQYSGVYGPTSGVSVELDFQDLLPPNLPWGPMPSPLHYVFNDGVVSISDGMVLAILTNFWISTDSQGNIVLWSLDASAWDSDNNLREISTNFDGTSARDFGVVEIPGYSGSGEVDTPGKWRPVEYHVTEPSSLLLLLLGLLGYARCCWNLH